MIKINGKNRELTRLSCFLTDAVVCRCLNEYGRPDGGKIQKVILEGLKIASGEGELVDYNNFFEDERFKS
jgi:hypothetical protein